MQTLDTNKDKCLMSCYMSDGWGNKVRTVSIAAADGLKVVREGRFKHGILFERSMLRGFFRHMGRSSCPWVLARPLVCVMGQGAGTL